MTISENSTPVPVSDETLNEILNELLNANTYLDRIGVKQDEIYLYLQEPEPELTEEEKAALEEKELFEQQFREELLDTLHDINSGIVSQNALLEENNRLLESVSMNSVSDNSVSQNAIMTTKLEDYSLTDSLLLILIIMVAIFGFIGLAFRKGE